MKPIKLKTHRPMFLARHPGIVTFVGAMIVFATYVVKENLQAGWTETAQAVDTAAATFAIRRDIEDFRKHVYFGEGPRDIIGFDVNGDYMDFEFEADLLSVSQARLEAIDSLLDKMPNETLLRGRYDALKTAWQQSEKLLNSDKEHESRYQGPAPSRRKLYIEKGFYADPDGVGVAESVESLTEDTLSHAEDLRRRNKRKAKSAAIASAILFTFGWGISLTGRLYGGFEKDANGAG